jgi:hypothetical protein
MGAWSRLGADGADALQRSARDDHRFLATMTGGGLEGCGPSQPWAAVNKHHFTAPTERTPGAARNGVQFLSVSDATGPHNEAPSSTCASSLVYLAKNVRYRMFSDLISYGKKATPNPGPGRAIRIC